MLARTVLAVFVRVHTQGEIAHATSQTSIFPLRRSAAEYRQPSPVPWRRHPRLPRPAEGTAAPPGLYIGNVLWVYPTDTIKDANGDTVNPQHNLHITSTAEMILVELATNHKFLGANVGFQAAVPWIKNKIQLNSLDAQTNFAFSDTFVSPIVLGWETKRADFIAGYNLYLPMGFRGVAAEIPVSACTAMSFSSGQRSTSRYAEKDVDAAGNFALEFRTPTRRHQHQRR